MKLAFWTRGMPEWPVNELAANAVALGYQGIDLRCTRPVDGRPSDGGNVSVAEPDESIDTIKHEFATAGVELASLLCYITGGHRGTTSDWPTVEADVREHANFARRLGAPRIRITVGHPADGTDWDTHIARLWSAVGSALDGSPGVSAVFENHPGSANAEQLLEAAVRFEDPRLGVLFSPDHCVVMQEDVLDLIERYAPQIHQVCFADRRPVQEDLARFDGEYYHVRYEPCWPGEGIVPTRKILGKLADRGFEGFISLKWEKSPVFGHNLPDGETVLPYFPKWMAELGFRASDGPALA